MKVWLVSFLILFALFQFVLWVKNFFVPLFSHKIIIIAFYLHQKKTQMNNFCQPSLDFTTDNSIK